VLHPGCWLSSRRWLLGTGDLPCRKGRSRAIFTRGETTRRRRWPRSLAPRLTPGKRPWALARPLALSLAPVSRPVGVRPARQLRSPPQVRCLLPAAQLSNAPARRIQRLRGAGGVADGGVADGGGADGAGLAGVGLGLQGCGRCASGEMLGVLALGWTPSVGRMHARRPQSRHWCDPTHTPSCFRQPTRVLAA
jgi:hypothetical protein